MSIFQCSKCRAVVGDSKALVEGEKQVVLTSMFILNEIGEREERGEKGERRERGERGERGVDEGERGGEVKEKH